MHAEVVLFDHHAGPHQRHQLVFAQHALAVFKQHQQQVKGTGTQRSSLPRDQNLALGRQNLKAVKAVGRGQGMLSGMARMVSNRFIMALGGDCFGALLVGRLPCGWRICLGLSGFFDAFWHLEHQMGL